MKSAEVMKIIEAMREFVVFCSNFSSYGVNDSEPTAIIYGIFRKARQGKEVNIPTTAEEWELYSSMADSDTVAAGLHDAVQKMVEAIQNCSIRDIPHLKQMF